MLQSVKIKENRPIPENNAAITSRPLDVYLWPNAIIGPSACAFQMLSFCCVIPNRVPGASVFFFFYFLPTGAAAFA